MLEWTKPISREISLMWLTKTPTSASASAVKFKKFTIMAGKKRCKRPTSDDYDDWDESLGDIRKKMQQKEEEDNVPLFSQATPVKSGAMVAPAQGGLVATTPPTVAKSAMSSINVAGSADRGNVRVWDQRAGSWKLVYLASNHGLKFVPVKLERNSGSVADQASWEDSEDEPSPGNEAVPFRDPFHGCPRYPELRRWKEEAIRSKNFPGGGRRMGQEKMEMTSFSQKRQGKPLVLFTLIPANDILVPAGLKGPLKISSRDGFVIWN